MTKYKDAWGDVWTRRHYERYYVIRVKDNNIGCFWEGKGLVKLCQTL